LTAQTILKKKEVSEKLVQIKTEIDENNYEAAFNIFFDKENVILAENVKKKEIEKYNGIKATLENKKNEFEKTNDKVESLITAYNSKNFDKAIELLSIKLSKENSYKKTQKKLEEILPKIKTTKSSCEENKVNIAKWKQGFENQEYENIYKILDYSNTFSNCFYKSDFSELRELQNDLKPLHEIYISTQENTVDKPQKVLKGINYSYLDYEKSIQLIEQLNGFLASINSEPEKLKGKNPLLSDKIKDTKQEIEKELIKLKEFSDANKPLSPTEIKALLFNPKKISIPQIEKYFNPIDEDDIWDLGNIYNLDVIRYYDLKEYDTELKQEVFKGTSEYKTKLSELKKLKNESVNTFYCLTLNDGSYDNKRMLTDGGSGGKYPVEYDVKKGGFNINLGAFNMAMGGLPQVYRERFEMKSIPIKKIQAYNEYGQLYDDYSFYRQMAFFPMDKSTGLKFEKNRENIKVIALFKIDKIDIRKVLRISYYDYWYIASISKVRIIAYNKQTDEIYYDKIY